MGLNRFKLYLLLEDNTIKLITRNKVKVPHKYRGRRVIFAAYHLEDITML
jgi:hypothetical protein